MVREPLVHRNDIPGEPRASRRRNATSIVRPRHSADDAGAVRVVFARYAMGGRSQNRRQPSPEISRVVSQTRTFLQRRHGRRSKTLLERAEFFNVSASAGQCRNSNRPHGKTHGSALLRGIKSAKSSSGEECIRGADRCRRYDWPVRLTLKDIPSFTLTLPPGARIPSGFSLWPRVNVTE